MGPRLKGCPLHWRSKSQHESCNFVFSNLSNGLSQSVGLTIDWHTYSTYTRKVLCTNLRGSMFQVKLFQSIQNSFPTGVRLQSDQLEPDTLHCFEGISFTYIYATRTMYCIDEFHWNSTVFARLVVVEFKYTVITSSQVCKYSSKHTLLVRTDVPFINFMPLNKEYFKNTIFHCLTAVVFACLSGF